MKYFIVLSLVMLVFVLNNQGQVTSEGTPFFYKFDEKSEIPILDIPPIDLKKLIKEDKKLSDSNLKKLRFAKVIDVNINPDVDGKWITIKEGKLWYYRIKSQDAYSLSLFFNKYRLPPNASLYVYSADRKHVKGAFTYINNKSNNKLALSPVKGDDVIIEYFEPFNVSFTGELSISSVAHDYKNIFQYFEKDAKGFGGSGSCNVNINCDNSDLAQLLKRAVCKITYNGWLCTGTLINNTKQNAYPYLLTANHCINNSFDANAAIFYFNYESAGCANVDGPTDQTISGSVIKATPEVKTLDFSLLELSTNPPPSYFPYYAGWNRDLENPDSVFSIHHPSGDIKKISKAKESAVLGDYGEGYTEYTHWWVSEWTEGTTEGGSSGSPLFNQDGLIIGDLTGGDASCSFNFNDYYLQFHHAWDYYSSSSKKLQPWLDPINKKPMMLDGYLPYDTIPSNLRASIDDTTIILKWNVTWDKENVDHYVVYRDSVNIGTSTTATYSDDQAYKDTVYTYYITAKYTSPVKETSGSNQITIRTMDPLTLSFVEDFEGSASIPESWYEERTNDTIGWKFKTGGFTGIIDTAYEGTVNAFFKDDSGNKSKLVLPRFKLSAYSNVLLSFYVNMQALNGKVDELNVLYKDVDSVKWEVIRNYNAYSPEWKKLNVPLPDLSANYQLAIEGIGHGGPGICLDSIVVIENSSPIVVSFNITNPKVCSGDVTQFSTSLSSSYNFKWDFGKGAIPETALGKGPHEVIYNSPGIKTATLTVNDTYSKTIIDAVTVYDAQKPVFTISNNVLTSSSAHGNQWYLNGKAISGAIEKTYTITEDGSYYVEVSTFNCKTVSETKYLVINSLGEVIEENRNAEAIQLFPNPSNGRFTIKFNYKLDKNIVYNYEVIDITGRIKQKGTIKPYVYEKEIVLKKTSEGIHFIHIYSNKDNFVSKVIIKK